VGDPSHHAREPQAREAVGPVMIPPTLLSTAPRAFLAVGLVALGIWIYLEANHRSKLWLSSQREALRIINRMRASTSYYDRTSTEETARIIKRLLHEDLRGKRQSRAKF
jgi:hypothetical protein